MGKEANNTKNGNVALKPLRLLIAEDSQNDADLVIRELKRGGFDPKWKRVETARDMENALDAESWDLIISDFKMLNFSGLEALQLLQKKNIDIPFIIASGTIGEQTAVSIMKAGASDYIMKDNMSRLPSAVERELRDAEERKARKITESKLRESETLFRTLTKMTPTGIYLTDTKGNCIYANEKWLEMAGMTLDEALGNGWIKVLHPDDREFVLSNWNKMVNSKGKWNLEYRFQTASGKTTTILGLATELRDEKGNIAGYVGTNIDITESKQLKEALEKRIITLTSPLESTDDIKFEDLFNVEEIQKIQDSFANATGVASIITDTNGQPITKPSNFCDLCQNIIRKTEKGLANCYHSDAVIGRMNLNGPVMQPCLSGGLWDGGASICVGDRHIANWLIGQVLDESIDQEKMMEYAREISADEKEFRKALKTVTRMPKKQFEKICQALFLIAGQLSKLALQNVQQARYITERKHFEERLRQSEKMEAIGQLAGGIAHDFNNQLAGIMGYAEMLVARLDDKNLREYAENIFRASHRAADLTRNILAFSRKGKYLTVPVNVHKVIEEVISILTHSIDKKIEIKRKLSASPAMISGDPTQLQNTLLNLAINARDAISDSGEIVFTTENISMDEVFDKEELANAVKGHYMKICVSDSGIGMDNETIKHIFEPFYTTKDVGKGTGMGLASVYGTVKNHNGVIKVDSKPGKGSIFSLYFPVLEDAVVNEEVKSESVNNLKEAHILLVEDEKIVSDMVAGMLRSFGHKVISCYDGVEAIEIYRKSFKTIDIVILDMVMPKMSGKEVFITLKDINPDIKVILSSGYSIDGDAQNIIDAGAKAFIQKPFNIKDLSKCIEDVLNGLE